MIEHFKQPKKFPYPLPETDRELEIISAHYFGAPLHLDTLRVYDDTAQYKVKELYSAYHGDGFEYGRHCTVGYEHSGYFWEKVIGNLYCGGIAGHSYGQTRIRSYRQRKRLEKWISNRSKGISYARKPFERLARQSMGREKTA